MGESVPGKIHSIHFFENSSNRGSQKRGLTVLECITLRINQ